MMASRDGKRAVAAAKAKGGALLQVRHPTSLDCYVTRQTRILAPLSPYVTRKLSELSRADRLVRVT